MIPSICVLRMILAKGQKRDASDTPIIETAMRATRRRNQKVRRKRHVHSAVAITEQYAMVRPSVGCRMPGCC